MTGVGQEPGVLSTWPHLHLYQKNSMTPIIMRMRGRQEEISRRTVMGTVGEDRETKGSGHPLCNGTQYLEGYLGVTSS